MRIDDKGVLINYHDDPDVTRLVIPDGVKKIAPHAFYGTEYLEEVVIPDGVEEIGAGAFEGSHELKSVIMPDTVKELGKAAFKDCRFLTDIRLSAGLKDIPSQAFDCCHSLSSALIPAGVKMIGFYAFNSCVSMNTVSLPDSLEFIDNGAFMETFSLKSISIPDNVDDIGSYTFFRSAIEHISYRGMEICLERDNKYDFDMLDFCFTRSLHEWLANGCKGKTIMPKELEDPFRIAYYAKTRDPRLFGYIKDHFPQLFKTIIRTGNIPAVSAMTENGFLSLRNINRYINYASEQEQHEIYLMLMSYKEQLGGKSSSPTARLRL